MTSERKIQNEIRLAVGRHPGATIWRNQVGVTVHAGRTVTYGLCRGSSDLIGIREVLITPEHVGKTIGQFVALEIKTETGRLSAEQSMYLALVNKRGGVGVVVMSPEDAIEALARCTL